MFPTVLEKHSFCDQKQSPKLLCFRVRGNILFEKDYYPHIIPLDDGDLQSLQSIFLYLARLCCYSSFIVKLILKMCIFAIKFIVKPDGMLMYVLICSMYTLREYSMDFSANFAEILIIFIFGA